MRLASPAPLAASARTLTRRGHPECREFASCSPGNTKPGCDARHRTRRSAGAQRLGGARRPTAEPSPPQRTRVRSPSTHSGSDRRSPSSDPRPTARVPNHYGPAGRPPRVAARPSSAPPSPSPWLTPGVPAATSPCPRTAPPNCYANSRRPWPPTPAHAPPTAPALPSAPSRTPRTPHGPRHKQPQPPPAPHPKSSPPQATLLVMETQTTERLRVFVFLGMMLDRASSRNFLPKLCGTYPSPSVWWRPRARAETPWKVVDVSARLLDRARSYASEGRAHPSSFAGNVARMGDQSCNISGVMARPAIARDLLYGYLDSLDERDRGQASSAFDLSLDGPKLARFASARGQHAPDVESLLRRMVAKGEAHRLQAGRYLVNRPGLLSPRPRLDDLEPVADLVLRRLDHSYYLSWHTGLWHHGLIEQQSRTVLCAVTVRKRPVHMGAQSVRFVSITQRKFFGFSRSDSYEVPVWVADLEKSLLD